MIAWNVFSEQVVAQFGAGTQRIRDMDVYVDMKEKKKKQKTKEETEEKRKEYLWKKGDEQILTKNSQTRYLITCSYDRSVRVFKEKV